MENSHPWIKKLGLAFAATLLLSACGGSGDDKEPGAPDRAAAGKSNATVLKAYASCAALEADLKSLAAAEIETWFEMSGQPVYASGGPLPADAGGNAAEDSVDFTNNQVNGVDEGDFTKTDGSHLFVLNGGALHRFDIAAPGQLQTAGSLDIEGWPQSLLMQGNRVLVFSAVSAAMNQTGDASPALFMLPTLAKATLIEWPQGAQPTVIEERYFDGYFLTARNLNGSAHSVLHGRLPNSVLDHLWQYQYEHEDKDAAKAAALEDLSNLALSDLLPRSYVRDESLELTALPYTENDCATFRMPEDSNGRGVTSLISLAMDSGGFNAEHIVSNYPVVYVSDNHLYLAEAAHDWWWYWWNDQELDMLNLHAFALETNGTAYKASARIKGRPNNQFALDEYNGVLRVATWLGQGRWWSQDAQVESRLYTLAVNPGSLDVLGELDGIAPGEGLFAARFAGERAYLVTFEQIDPLFTVDLSDPANPRIAGELEVPGFSTYLHPVDDDRLLAVGIGGDENGATWNTVVSLFDVADMAAPQLITRYDLARDNNGWSWSEALYEHKAFQFNKALGLLALPLGASHEDANGWQWQSTLELIKLDTDTLSHHGSIDHSVYFANNDQPWYVSPDIRRSFFIGDYIYAISDKAVTVHATDNPATTVADAPLPGPDPQDFYWTD